MGVLAERLCGEVSSFFGFMPGDNTFWAEDAGTLSGRVAVTFSESSDGRLRMTPDMEEAGVWCSGSAEPAESVSLSGVLQRTAPCIRREKTSMSTKIRPS